MAGGGMAEAGREAAAALDALTHHQVEPADELGDATVVDASNPPTVAAMATSTSLRHNRDFKIVLVGQGVSALGDAITFTALPLMVVALTGSGVAMGTVGVLQTATTAAA